MAEAPVNPYVGPRPFEREDASRFFGRIRESRDVVSLVIAQRVLLLYSASGAGKSSLLNAGVLPLLEQEKGFDVLPVARVRADDPTVEANVFVSGLLASLDTGADSHRSLAQLLGSRSKASLVGLRVLVVDQFEELFTAHPERWQERPGVFSELRDAMELDPGLRVVLAIREDFLAQLDPFAALVPGGLRTRFRLERLDRASALAAVKNPLADTGRSFALGAAEALVDDLLRFRVDTGRGRSEEVEGEYVEPVQLQVSCRTLWADLPADVTEITTEHLSTYAEVDQVLARFYDDAVATAAGTGRGEGRVRDWVEETLITAGSTRGAAYAGADATAGMPTKSVQALEEKRLIRAEWRAGARWYELTHDRLIEPIRRSNTRYRAERFRRRLRRIIIMVAVLVFAFIVAGLVRAVTQPAASAPSADVSVSSISRNVRKGSYLQLIGQKPTGIDRLRLGNLISLQLTSSGYEGTFLVIQVYTIPSGGAGLDAVGPPGQATVQPSTASEISSATIWMPLPARGGRFVYQIVLSEQDGNTLTALESEPFVVLAGSAAEPIANSAKLKVVRTGPGTIVSTPAGISCGSECSSTFAQGTAVSLVPLPASGAVFTGWEGASCGAAATACTVKVGAVTLVAASFTRRLTHVLGRSVNGTPIEAVRVGTPGASRKVLVIGCVHGNQCNGTAIATLLANAQSPADVDLWIVPKLNPDGLASGERENANGVDLNRNFPWHWDATVPGAGTGPLSEPESSALHKLIRRLRPELTIWFFTRDVTSKPPVVDTSSGGDIAIVRRYARLVGLPLDDLGRFPGSAITWQNEEFPGTTAFAVDLPHGSLSQAAAKRHTNAILGLARG